MKTNRRMLFISVALVSLMSVTIPVSADVINASYTSGGKYQKVKTRTNCNKKGRNKSGNKAQKVVLSGSDINCNTPKKIGKFKNPKMGGLRVDACVLGSGWNKSNPKRCDARRLGIVANDFCKSKGFKKSILVAKTSHKGRHAVLTFRKGRPRNSYWKRKTGNAVIKSIYCQ